MKKLQIKDLEKTEEIDQKEMKKIVGGGEPIPFDSTKAATFAFKLWKRSLGNGEFLSGVREGGKGPTPG